MITTTVNKNGTVTKVVRHRDWKSENQKTKSEIPSVSPCLCGSTLTKALDRIAALDARVLALEQRAQARPLPVRRSSISPRTSALAIIAAVAEHYRTTPDEIRRTHSRIPTIVRPRQVAQYFLRRAGRLTGIQIAKLFHLREHSCVWHNAKTIQNLRDSDPAFDQEIEKLAATLDGGASVPASRV